MNGARLAKASVWLDDDDAAYLVAETPSEAADAIGAAIERGSSFAELTSGNSGPWNGKPFFLRARSVRAITPPMNQDDD